MKHISDNDKSMFFIIRELSKVLRFYQNEAAFCEGVTFTQFNILDLVSERAPLGLSELHGLLSVEKSTTTRLVNPLVKKGLLNRIPSQYDSRAVNLVLTKAGKQVHESVWECLADNTKKMMNQIPREKHDDVFEALKLFIQACTNSCSGAHCSSECCE